MAEKSLGLKISELIWEHYPLVKECDQEAAAEAAADLAGVLGCLVAMMTLRDPEFHDPIMATIVDKIEHDAKKVRGNAYALSREPGHA